VHTISVAPGVDIEHAWFAAHSTDAAHAHVKDEAQASGRDAHAKLGSRTQHGPLPGDVPDGHTPPSSGNTQAPPWMIVRTHTWAAPQVIAPQPDPAASPLLAPSGCADEPPQASKLETISAARRFMTAPG
jgi:hypothetical protein